MNAMRTTTPAGQ